MTDRPLSRREGRPPLGGPYEGVPDHLRQPLRLWVLEQFMKDGGRSLRTGLLYRVIAAEQITEPEHPQDDKTASNIFGHTLLRSVMSHCVDDENLLDVIHTLLKAGRDSLDLDRILEAGNSVWTVANWEEDGLVRRVEATATAAYEEATSPSDKASAELHEAWLKAYSRDSDPADAWDHAIKAVETILIPIVEPNNSRATLSNVIGDLRAQANQWKLLLRGRARDHSVAPLVQMLELMWVDPNRHGGSSTPEVPATLEEARAIVHLAVTIVQWGRDGLIVRR